MSNISKLSVILLVFFSFILCGCNSPEKNNNDNKNTTTNKVSKKEKKQYYYTNSTVGYKIPITSSWKIEEVPNTDIFLVNKDGTFTPEPSVNVVTVKANKYELWDKKAQKKLKDEIDKNLVTASEKEVTLAGQHAYNIVYGLENKAVSIIVNQTYLFYNGYFMVITCSSRESEYNRFEEIFNDFIEKIDFTEAK